MDRGSSSFLYESKKLKAMQSDNGYQVVLLGDSTAALGFKPNYFNTLSSKKILDLSLAGSWIFTQHKLAEHVLTGNKSIKDIVVIIGPDQFTDGDNYRIKSNLEFCKTDLKVSDVCTLWSYKCSYYDFFDSTARLVYRPFLFNNDIQHLMLNPIIRAKQIPETFHALTRRNNSNQKQDEDDRASDVCNIGKLEDLEKNIQQFKTAGNAGEAKKLDWILEGYKVRKYEKKISEGMELRIDNYISYLSKNFKTVYVVNAPVYVNFDTVYSRQFQYDAENTTKQIVSKYNNVRYISRNNEINNDCSGFLDVVHLNVNGAQNFTKYIYYAMKIMQ
jgi:hypothetical protein